MKQNLIEEISILLLKKGFTIKSLTRNCFDILARKEDCILLIKALEDANSITIEYANEMKKLCSYLSASPLIIAENAGYKLKANVIYSRFGVYTLNLETLMNTLNNEMPFVKSTHAGLTVHISGEKFKRGIEGRGLSLSSISQKIGVSKKMVERYQKGEVDITISNAIKIHKLFGDNVFQKIDILSSYVENEEKASSDVGKKYAELGFKATETKKVPFDLISRKDNNIILTDISDKVNPHLQSISRLIGADKLVIFRKKKPKGIPAVTKKEFMDFDKSYELIRFLREY